MILDDHERGGHYVALAATWRELATLLHGWHLQTGSPMVKTIRDLCERLADDYSALGEDLRYHPLEDEPTPVHPPSDRKRRESSRVPKI